MQPRFLRLVALALPLLVALYGCSESNDSGDDATAGTSPSSSGGTGSSTSDGGTTGGSQNTPSASDAGAAGGSQAGAAPSAPVANQTSPPPEPPGEPPIDNEQTAFYFSYDESTSTAARDLSLFGLDNGLRPAPSLGRPFEFLNAESFEHFAPEPAGDFTVSMGLLSTTEDDLPTTRRAGAQIYALGVNLSGPEQTREQRRNVVLTVLLDVSGSMDSSYALETRRDISSLLQVAKYGLSGLPATLKSGDVLNLVTFSTNARVITEAQDGTDERFINTIDGLLTEGSTNIDAGLQLAYEVANRNFDPQKANRVVIVTDAYVNTGEVNADVIARQTVINGLEGIYFSGVGVGSGFNDGVLNTLTDAGRGSYSAMITPNDADRLFTEGFSRFVEPAATEVRFRLSYPQQLDQFQPASEEISTEAEDIQPVNFSYNSDQFFYELFTGPQDIRLDQNITLDIDYTDTDGERRQASQTHTLDELLSQGEVPIRSAAMVATLAQVIAGKIECDTVQNSLLYNSPVSDATYERYRGSLADYCAQQPPYNYMDW